MPDGLEVVPRTSCPCRGGDFEEMDLAAVLVRRPQVAIVDEFAHSNVPCEGRNPQRRQDIEELLAAGIDVITAVNIQHLESLNDVVEKVTHVPQHETVPDEVDAALANYFRPGNLTALRQLALPGAVARPGVPLGGVEPGCAAGPAVLHAVRRETGAVICRLRFRRL